MKQLNNTQKQHLRRLANDLRPAVQIGKNGLTDQIHITIDHELNAHELIKIKFMDFKEEKRQLTEALVETSNGTLIGLVGSMVWLDWQMSLIAAVMYPIAVVPILKLGKRIRRASGGMQERMGETAAQLTETADKHFAGQSDLYVAAVDLEAIGGDQQPLAAQHPLQRLDLGSGPVGEIGQRAGLDPTTLAIAFAQEDGGRRTAVRHARDVHDQLESRPAMSVKRN